VLDAVVELLEEGGARAVTIAEVAKRSGVNASSIYRRWHGVDALILDAAQDLSLDTIEVADTGSLEDDLCATATSVAAFLRTDLGIAMARALIDAPPEVLERIGDRAPVRAPRGAGGPTRSASLKIRSIRLSN